MTDAEEKEVQKALPAQWNVHRTFNGRPTSQRLLDDGDAYTT
jgi:hypothetical protein